MATCEACGNEHDRSFEVVRAGETHVFDSFECAIDSLAADQEDEPPPGPPGEGRLTGTASRQRDETAERARGDV